MRNGTFTLSFEITGLERKVVASIIAQTLGQEASYAGVPSFSYQAGGWKIDREGMVSTPETPIEQKDSIRPVLDYYPFDEAVFFS